MDAYELAEGTMRAVGYAVVPTIIAWTIADKRARDAVHSSALSLRITALEAELAALRRPTASKAAPYRAIAPAYVATLPSPTKAFPSVCEQATVAKSPQPAPRAATLTTQSTTDAPVESPPSLEERVGANWLTRAGAAVFLLGVLLFLGHAVEQQWLGPAGRVAAAGTTALLLVAAAELASKRARDGFAHVLLGTGLSAATATVWAAAALYQLIPDSGALACEALILAGGAWLTVRHRAEGAFIVCVIAGLVTPLVLNTSQSMALTVCSLLAVTTTAFVVAARASFPRVAWTALLGALASGFAFAGAPFVTDGAHDAFETMGAVGAVSLQLFAIATTWSRIAVRDSSSTFESVMLWSGVWTWVVGALFVLGQRLPHEASHPEWLCWSLIGGLGVAVVMERSRGATTSGSPLGTILFAVVIGGLVASAISAPVHASGAAVVGALMVGWPRAGSSAATRAHLAIAGAWLVLVVGVRGDISQVAGATVVAVVVSSLLARRYQAWGWLLGTTTVAGLLWTALAAVAGPRHLGGDAASVLIAATVATLVVVGMAASRLRRVRRSERPLITALVAMSITQTGVIAALLEQPALTTLWWAATAASLGGLAVAAFNVRRAVVVGRHWLLLAFGHAGVLVALVFDGTALSVAWSALAIAGIRMGQSFRRPSYAWLSATLLGLTTLRVLVVEWATSGPVRLVNAPLLSLVALGLGWLVWSRAVARGALAAPRQTRFAPAPTLIGPLLSNWTGHGLLLTAWMATVASATGVLPLLVADLSAGLYGVVVLFLGLRLRSVPSRLFGLSLLGLLVVKLGTYDVWVLSEGHRIFVLLGLGATLVLGGYFYARLGARFISLWRGADGRSVEVTAD